MHIPVMLHEVISFLDLKSDGLYIDATFGAGGHSKEILRYLNNNGKLIVLDKNFISYNLAKKLSHIDKRVNAFNLSFDHFVLINKKMNTVLYDGVVVDLGLSSLQYDSLNLGFGFKYNSFLDMRLNSSQNIRVIDWLNFANYFDLVEVFSYFGDYKFADYVAIKILKFKKNNFIKTTYDLHMLFIKTFGKVCYNSEKFLSKIFILLRIFINNDVLLFKIFLYNIFNILNTNGVLILISFNSLENKIIKKIFINKFFDKKYFDFKTSFEELDFNFSSKSANIKIFKKK